MKKITLILSVALLAVSCKTTKKAEKPANTKPDYSKGITLTNYNDTVSYALGLLYGDGFKKQGFDNMNNELLLEIFGQMLSGELTTDSAIIAPQDANAIVNNYFIKQKEIIATKNLEEGQTFLAANKTKEGIKTTESGLQYKVLKEGNGATPNATSSVSVYYKGTLIDGRVFDQTQPGKPATFGVNQVIKGWTEGLQLMKEGAKYMFYIPSNLAYGDRGAQGSIIGANATLIFEVELVKVN